MVGYIDEEAPVMETVVSGVNDMGTALPFVWEEL